MKNLHINFIILLVSTLFVLSSCETFLNRPPEDTYTVDGFFKTDEQCFQAANVLYNSPWYDYQRGFVSIGDVLAGNIFKGTDNHYQNFNMTASDDDIINAYNSLWLANGHCNAVIDNVKAKAGAGVSATTKNTVIGEAMTWKAMAYFFLVRGWGAVPIIHDNNAVAASGASKILKKNRVEDVYEYIIRTLKKSAELLPAHNESGRISKYGAYGLLAKVYLTRAGWGQNGSRKQEDLDNAKLYAGKVINESGSVLEPDYANLFRMSTGNRNSENLISWQWVVSTTWTSQNTEQSDLALSGFTGMNDSWGTWVGPSIDLQKAFGDSARSKTRNNTDSRRKATMMMYNDYYPYFWRDKGGFTATWDDKNNVAGATFGIGTGANCVKHIVGNVADHTAEIGYPSGRMATSLATHLLRLADVYLIYAEACLPSNASYYNTSSTSDANALKYYNAVRRRAIPTWVDKSSITFKDVFTERRLELACEGDNWFDIVRLFYFSPADAKKYINNQERGSYNSLVDYYAGKATYEQVTTNTFHVNITDDKKFYLPFPSGDVAINPNLSDNVDPVPFDFGSIDY